MMILNKLAQAHVGDCKTPNLFFVSVGGKTKMVGMDGTAAYEYWKKVSKNKDKETSLEDRLVGCICSMEPKEVDSKELIVIDEFQRFYGQKK